MPDPTAFDAFSGARAMNAAEEIEIEQRVDAARCALLDAEDCPVGKPTRATTKGVR